MNHMRVVFACLIMFNVTSVVWAGEQELSGAGATFPDPLYVRMFDAYHRQFGVKVNYQPIGSGGGIQQLINKTVDFGGTDAYMTHEETKQAGADVLHIPTCLGAVTVTYNLPGDPEIKLTPDAIAGIFLRKVTKWDDPQIAKTNAGVKLPSRRIIVVHRSDGSGTTFIFSDYLSKISKEWKDTIGCGKSLSWPRDTLGGQGNAGVAGIVTNTTYSIGYVELTYALANRMPVAVIQNRSGNFIKPSPQSVTAAARVDIPADTKASITDAAAPDAYPISGFTWLIFYKEQSYKGRTVERARELVKLMSWIIHEGQAFPEALHYAPLPQEVVKKAEAILSSVVYGGTPIAVQQIQ